MKLTFVCKIGAVEASFESYDWVVPPRVGDSVFLIEEADLDDGRKRIVQFDGPVKKVKWYGPHHAFVEIERKSDD